MRRLVCAACAWGLVCALSLAGCGGGEARTQPSQQQGVSEVMEQQMQREDGTTEAPAQESGSVAASKTTYTDDQVEIDLTTMGADMVYATVFDMVSNPANYVGKVVRMSGPYYHTLYEANGNDYFYVIVEDATACCSQGLEFVWDDGTHVYPADYPQDGTRVTVTGIFMTYMEGEQGYAHLVSSQLEVNA